VALSLAAAESVHTRAMKMTVVLAPRLNWSAYLSHLTHARLVKEGRCFAFGIASRSRRSGHKKGDRLDRPSVRGGFSLGDLH